MLNGSNFYSIPHNPGPTVSMENSPILALSGLESQPLGNSPRSNELISKKQLTFIGRLQHAGSGVLLEAVPQLRYS